MLNRLFLRPSNGTLKKAIIIGVLLLTVSAPTVIWTLEASNYPGSLDKTQLGFDSEYIRECFSTMNEREMSSFILGNLFDYVFMASYAALLSSSSLLLSRRLTHPLLNKIGYAISLMGVLAALSDAAENVFIISMAVNPKYFPSWLALPHSLFAHTKFTLMYITAGWILIVALIQCINLVHRMVSLILFTTHPQPSHV